MRRSGEARKEREERACHAADRDRDRDRDDNEAEHLFGHEERLRANQAGDRRRKKIERKDNYGVGEDGDGSC